MYAKKQTYATTEELQQADTEYVNMWQCQTMWNMKISSVTTT